MPKLVYYIITLTYKGLIKWDYYLKYLNQKMQEMWQN